MVQPATALDAATPGPVIAARNLDLTFATNDGPVHALRDVNLTIDKGEFVSFIGPSGCGKTTLLRVIAALEHPTGGTITVNGMTPDAARMQRAYGYVFQAAGLYPWRTIEKNIKLPLEIMGFDRAEQDRRVRDVLALVDLEGFGKKFPWQLSGGMQQRASIARALAFDADILLMDEPFGALDAQTREVMHDLIRHVHRLEKSTILFVTHDVEEAIYLGGRVVLMAPRPGRIDTIYDVPLPAQRHQDMKLSAEFLDLKRTILARIRETSGVNTDLELLEKLTRSIPA